ncbi:MAG: ribosome maturation factor RimP [Neisseriaceae bacterium]|nr:ribosome maturation factor RimP [Neisseriaceae bacterium]
MDIEQLLDKTLPPLGYECVDLEMTHTGTLRIFIDKEGGITVDDCAAVSNHLSRLFMVENVDYERLEISSPGLDRVLKKEKDFVRFVGRKATVKLRLPDNGRKKFVGVIKHFENNTLTLTVDGEDIAIALSNIEKARLKPEF